MKKVFSKELLKQQLKNKFLSRTFQLSANRIKKNWFTHEQNIYRKHNNFVLKVRTKNSSNQSPDY